VAVSVGRETDRYETLIDLDPSTLTLAAILERLGPLINHARADGKALAVAFVDGSGGLQ
jgi:hypothetical protein